MSAPTCGHRSTSAEAEGRPTLSTAFVRAGPAGRITMELLDGRVLAIGNVVMNSGDYCGLNAAGDATAAKYRGRYLRIAVAWPGSGLNPPTAEP